jgi:hypothetical protein
MIIMFQRWQHSRRALSLLPISIAAFAPARSTAPRPRQCHTSAQPTDAASAGPPSEKKLPWPHSPSTVAIIRTSPFTHWL